jgi:hypothetical protein
MVEQTFLYGFFGPMVLVYIAKSSRTSTPNWSNGLNKVPLFENPPFESAGGG